MLKAFLVALVIAAAILGFLVVLVAAGMRYADQLLNGIGDVADATPEALPRSPAVELAPAPRAALPVGGLVPSRDAVIGADDHTAARHARLRAFQQREAAVRSARRFM